MAIAAKTAGEAKPEHAADAASEQVVRLFSALPDLVDADPDLVRRGRFLTTEFQIGVGSLSLHVVIETGRVRSVVRGPFLLKPSTFALSAGRRDRLQEL